MYTKILKFKNAIPLLEVAGSELLPYMAPTLNVRKVQARIQIRVLFTSLVSQ